MNDEIISVRKVVKVSALLEDIKQKYKTLQENPDFDEGYFDCDQTEAYMKFLIEQHKDDWVVIDDRK